MVTVQPEKEEKFERCFGGKIKSLANGLDMRGRGKGGCPAYVSDFCNCMVVGGFHPLRWGTLEENRFGGHWRGKIMSLLLVMLNMKMFEISKLFHISVWVYGL